MASQTLQHRSKNDHTMSTKQETKNTNAKRALRSLVIATVIPVSLTMFNIFMFASGRKYRALPKPIWFPPLWCIHLGSLGSSFLMSFAAWLVWADGGFHAQPDAFLLYIAQVSLGIAWDPLVLVAGARWFAFVLCAVNFVTLFACYKLFLGVNPFAKDLVKPCVAWAAYLTTVTFKLIFL